MSEKVPVTDGRKVMSIIDFHSHILPGIDDGSRNVQTTKDMLDMCRDHSVDTMIATPHFYADADRVERFIERRQRAYDQVMDLGVDTPHIIMGAEVAYFAGMSRAEKLSALTIEGTNILLLEMPFETWNDSIVQEVRDLIDERYFHIILAHIERFIKLPGNRPYVEQVLELPLTVQVNAEALTDFRQRGKMLRMFAHNKAHILGSDCHGMHHRMPNLWEGRNVIAKKLGTEILTRIDDYGEKLLADHKANQ